MVRGIDVGNVPSDLDEGIWSSRGIEVHSGAARKGLISHVLLAASRSQGSAFERVFTVALLKILVGIGIDRLTYTTLFDRILPLSRG